MAAKRHHCPSNGFLKLFVHNKSYSSTGQVQSRECIEDVIRFAAKEGLFLMADEVLSLHRFKLLCAL